MELSNFHHVCLSDRGLGEYTWLLESLRFPLKKYILSRDDTMVDVLIEPIRLLYVVDLFLTGPTMVVGSKTSFMFIGVT